MCGQTAGLVVKIGLGAGSLLGVPPVLSVAIHLRFGVFDNVQHGCGVVAKNALARGRGAAAGRAGGVGVVVSGITLLNLLDQNLILLGHLHHCRGYLCKRVGRRWGSGQWEVRGSPHVGGQCPFLQGLQSAETRRCRAGGPQKIKRTTRRRLWSALCCRTGRRIVGGGLLCTRVGWAKIAMLVSRRA